MPALPLDDRAPVGPALPCRIHALRRSIDHYQGTNGSPGAQLLDLHLQSLDADLR